LVIIPFLSHSGTSFHSTLMLVVLCGLAATFGGGTPGTVGWKAGARYA